MKKFENWPTFSSPKIDSWHRQRTNYDIRNRERHAIEIAQKIRKLNNIQFNSVECCDLETKGVQFIDNLINSDQAKEMYEYFYNLDCYDFYNDHGVFKIKNVPNHVKLGRHTIVDNLKCPHMIDIITSDKVLNLASSFLCAPPTLTNLLPMWSFRDIKNNPINMQLFHRDAEDYKFIKFFVYLSDVEKGNGEQIYIKGTNKNMSLVSELYKIKRYDNDLITTHLNAQERIIITGSAGFSWASDPYGIHRGTVPLKTHRLLLQIQFSYNPVPIFNYRPYRFSKWDSMSELAKYATRLYLRC